MIKRTLFAAAISAFAGFSGATTETTFGNNEMQWRTYITDEPTVAFAESNGFVWYATATSVGKYQMKHNKKDLVSSLGALPSSGVHCMASDKTGTIWFGTSDGIASTKDGVRFKIFTTDEGLASNKINRLVVAKNGDVWAATGKGASVFRNGTWKSWTTADGLSGPDVRDIAEANDGLMWFATNNGLSTFDGTTWSKYDMTSGVSTNDIRAVAFDPRRGKVWAACGPADISSFDGKEWSTFMDIREDALDLMIDTQSRVWLSSAEGLIKYNGFEWVRDPQKIGFPAASVASMHRDSKGDLWFALETGILHLKNPYPY